jgi:hypothetical protein
MHPSKKESLSFNSILAINKPPLTNNALLVLNTANCVSQIILAHNVMKDTFLNKVIPFMAIKNLTAPKTVHIVK